MDRCSTTVESRFRVEPKMTSASLGSKPRSSTTSAATWTPPAGSSSTSPSWRTAFLNSPGSPGSNFSYTSPVIPPGTYSVLVRPTDHVDQIGETRTATGVVVNHPPNNAPVASGSFDCTQNVCTFDGTDSTDENPTGLTYQWTYGTAGSATGPTPVKTFTTPGTYDVTLTVKDEWGATASTVDAGGHHHAGG